MPPVPVMSMAPVLFQTAALPTLTVPKTGVAPVVVKVLVAEPLMVSPPRRLSAGLTALKLTGVLRPTLPPSVSAPAPAKLTPEFSDTFAKPSVAPLVMLKVPDCVPRKLSVPAVTLTVPLLLKAG